MRHLYDRISYRFFFYFPCLHFFSVVFCFFFPFRSLVRSYFTQAEKKMTVIETVEAGTCRKWSYLERPSSTKRKEKRKHENDVRQMKKNWRNKNHAPAALLLLHFFCFPFQLLTFKIHMRSKLYDECGFSFGFCFFIRKSLKYTSISHFFSFSSSGGLFFLHFISILVKRTYTRHTHKS